MISFPRFDSPDLKYFPGPPSDSIEEIIALTDPSLSLFTGEDKVMSELDQSTS
jgi:DNA (cytosine-5)-methyltransferase 1